MIQLFSDYPFVEAGFCNAEESPSLENPILMDQVHGADAIVLQEVPSSPPQCDALLTTTTGIKLTVKTADCAPVLFLDPISKVIAATHAGWKGAFQGILENTLLSMLKLGASLDNIHVAIGPHLTQQNFQVSSDTQNLFPKTEQHFFSVRSEGTYFDFTGYLEHRLVRVGIQHLQTYPIDTFSNKTYNSYRRDRENPARQYSFIQLIKGA